MNKQLQESKNKIVEDKDPAGILGLYAIAQAQTIDELKVASVKSINQFDDYFQIDKLNKLHEAAKNFLEHPEDQELQKQLHTELTQIAKITAIQKGKYIRSSVHSLDQDYVIDLRQKLVDEYKAYSTSEMLIVDLALNAYFRSMRCSSIYIAFVQNSNGTVRNNNQLHLNMMKELSKQIEIANRQFQTSITLLKELKQPPIKVKVHAKEAFVAQNQQFNKNA